MHGAAVPGAAAPASVPARHIRWVLLVLLSVCAINYADRSVVGAVAEPLRGQADGVQGDDTVPPLRAVARHCFSDPTFRHVLAGGTLAGFGLHGLGQFLGVYFARVHELSYGTAGMLYGLLTFASVGGGLLVGGFLSDVFGARLLEGVAGVHCRSPGEPLCLQAQGTGLRLALIASTVLFIWAGVHYLLASRRQPR